MWLCQLIIKEHIQGQNLHVPVLNFTIEVGHLQDKYRDRVMSYAKTLSTQQISSLKNADNFRPSLNPKIWHVNSNIKIVSS